MGLHCSLYLWDFVANLSAPPAFPGWTKLGLGVCCTWRGRLLWQAELVVQTPTPTKTS